MKRWSKKRIKEQSTALGGGAKKTKKEKRLTTKSIGHRSGKSA